VSNLIKNWKKESSHKARLEDWRTVNTANYTFACNGGLEHTAQQMQEIGISNALIQVTPPSPPLPLPILHEIVLSWARQFIAQVRQGLFLCTAWVT